MLPLFLGPEDSACFPFSLLFGAIIVKSLINSKLVIVYFEPENVFRVMNGGTFLNGGFRFSGGNGVKLEVLVCVLMEV